MCSSYYLDFLNARRMQQESAFYTNAVGSDAPYGEVGAGPFTPQPNNGASENLYALPITFDDTCMYPDSVARA
jgi:hypothetical protein